MLRTFFRKSPLIRGGQTWSRCAYYLQTFSVRSLSVTANSEFNQETDRISQQNESGSEERLSANTQVEKKEKSIMPSAQVMDRNPEDLYRRYFMTPDQPDNPRLLRVAIIGAPNSGKSTLINSLVGWKLNSVSTKVHTTRQNANTMFNIGDAQIIFVDTPGVITRKEKNRYYCEGKMLSEPQRGVEEADVVGVVVDVSNKWTRNQMHTELLKVLYLHRDIPSFLILNKIDSIRNFSLNKQQTFLLDVTKRLTEGKLGGKTLGRAKREKKKQIKPDNLFEALEQKYGVLKVKRKKNLKDVIPKRHNKIEIDSSNENLEQQFHEMNKKKVSDYLTTWLQVDFKAKGVDGLNARFDKPKKTDTWQEREDRILAAKQEVDGSQKLREELLEIFEQYRDDKNEMRDENSYQEESLSRGTLENCSESLDEDIVQEMNKYSEFEHNKNIHCDLSTSTDVGNNVQDKEGQSEVFCNDLKDTAADELSEIETIDMDVDKSDNKVENIELEESYQSEFLTHILSRPCEVFPDDNKTMKEEKEKLEIMNEVMEVKAAIEAVRDKYGWSGFDQVFPVSALDGQGIDSIREYLLKMSKPGDWVFHSSVVTDQHPFELAKLCVTQSLLDNVHTHLPYIIKPEIIYWDVDEYNRLNISVDVVLRDGHEMKQILGENTSERVRSITRGARQALMDTFQCEVRFKLSIKMKKKRGSR